MAFSCFHHLLALLLPLSLMVGRLKSRGLGGEGVGSLVLAALPGVFPLAWDSNSFWRLDLELR